MQRTNMPRNAALRAAGAGGTAIFLGWFGLRSGKRRDAAPILSATEPGRARGAHADGKLRPVRVVRSERARGCAHWCGNGGNHHKKRVLSRQAMREHGLRPHKVHWFCNANLTCFLTKIVKNWTNQPRQSRTSLQHSSSRSCETVSTLKC